MGVGYLAGQGGSGSNIKSIQRGNGNIGLYNLSITINISSVDLTKSVVLVNSTSSILFPAGNLLKASFVSATQIKLELPATATGTADVTFSWQVIEFNNVKTLQSGTVSIGSSQTQTISSVDTSKSVVFFSYNMPYQTAASIPIVGYLSNATTLQFTNQRAYVSCSATWFVIEFK